MTGEGADHDLGFFRLGELARLRISFDLSEVDDDFPLKLEVLAENEGGFYNQRDEWLREASLEVEDDADVMVELRPGFHRVQLAKENDAVYYLDTFEATAGENWMVLKPLPILVYGRVRDENGAVDDAIVKIVCSGISRETTSTENGRFELGIWTPGQCGAIVKTPNGAKWLENVDLRTAELGESFELNVEVPGRTISGVVIDADDGLGVSEAAVMLSQTTSGGSSGYSSSTTSDENGRFEFKGVREDNDENVIVVSAEGYVRLEESISVQQSPFDEMSIELHRAKRVKGRVVGPSGEPIYGAVVGCCAPSPSSRLPIIGQTDVQGEFSLDMNPGTPVFAAASGFSVGWAQVINPEDRITIALQARMAPTQLRLVDEGGRPVPGVPLLYSSDSAGVLPFGVLEHDAVLNRQLITTDASGVIMLTSLPRGLYRVWLSTHSGIVELGAVVVPSYGEVPLAVPH